MKPGSSEFGLVVGIVLFTAVILAIVFFAGDPETCKAATEACGGTR